MSIQNGWTERMEADAAEIASLKAQLADSKDTVQDQADILRLLRAQLAERTDNYQTALDEWGRQTKRAMAAEDQLAERDTRIAELETALCRAGEEAMFAEARCADHKRVLEWYADEFAYDNRVDSDGYRPALVIADGGERARAALGGEGKA